MRSDVVKFLIEVANALVKIIDKVGLLNVAVAAFAAKTAFKSDNFGILNWGKNKTNGSSSTSTLNTAEANAQNLDTAATQKNTDATNANIEAEQRSAQASNNSAAADNAEAQATANAAAADSAEANASNMEASADSAEAASSSAAASADAMETASSATSASADIAESQASMQAAAADAAEQIASEGAAMGDATEAATSGIAAAADAAEGASSGISALAGGLQAGSKAFKLFNAAATGAVALIASMVISAAVNYFYDLAHASEKAAEAAAEAISSYQSTQKTLNSQRSTVKELASSYEELSKGVDVNTNKNINLSTSSYQKYLDVCNDIADMYPDLVTGFDAQGNAILSLKGNVDELTNAYLEAAQANRQALIAGGDDVFKTFKHDYDHYAGVFDTTTGFKQSLELAQEFQEAIATGNQDTIQAVYDKYDNHGKYNVAVLKLFEAAGIDFAELTDFKLFKGNVVNVEKFQQASDKLLSYIKTTTSKINTSTSNVKMLMDAYLGENLQYTTLSQDAKTTIDQIISGLSADFINGFESAGDLWAWVKTNLVDAFSDSDLGQSISDSLSDAFNLQAKFKNGDIDIQSYKDGMLSFVNKIKNSGLTEDVQEQILQMFDIDWSKDDSVGENIDQMITYAQSIVDQNAKDQVLTLTYSDLQIINSDGFKVPAGVLLTWDDLQAKIKETKIAMTQDFTTDNFAEYAESVNAISSNISTYQEALEKLDNGTFTLSDFMDLISEFPDLADGVDIASKNFNGLSKNLKKAIRNSPDDLVDELKDLRDQLVEAGKSTDSIDALINSIENMPADAISALTEEYITLTDQINAAKQAQNELQEAMNENPNEGYETRGEAIERMKTLMEEGKIGSESELWSIAEEFGFTYDSAKTINENADALYNFITAREAWYATDDDGNYTYEGIESFIKYVQDKQDVLKKYGATWTYEDGVFNFDLDNQYWEDFAKEIGLTSEEFYDLMMQIGQFFDINWQDADDLIWYIDQINKGTESASEKFDSVEQAVKSFLESNGYSDDLLELSVDDEEFKKLPEEIQKILTEYYELKAKFEADPLGITYQLEKDSKTNTTKGLTYDSLKALNQLTTTITDTDTGVTWLSLEDLSENAKEAGMDMDALGERMRELVEAGKVIDLKTTAKDPLGLQSMQTDAQSTITYLQALGIAAQGLNGDFTINLPSFIDLMVAAGWGSEQIQAYINSLNSEGYTFTYTTEENETKTLDVNTEEGQAKIDELVAKSNELTDTETLTLNLDGTAEGVIAAIKSDLSTLTSSPYTITVNVDDTGVKLSNPNVSATVNYNAGTQEEPKDSNADVNYDLGTQEIPANETADVNYELGTQEAPEDKTATVTYTVEYEDSSQEHGGDVGKHFANGTAHVQGTAYKSGSWGAPATETALVGELGPEMVVRNGRWFTVGDNGAEFTDIQKGDIIFNHKQTEDLLSKGYVTGRGKAFAEGNAYVSGGGSHQTFEFSDTEGEEISNAAGKLSKAAEDISNSADEFKEVFDWIEVRIEEITEDINLKSAKLENAVGSTKQNAIIDDMIALNKTLYDNLTAGAAKYDEYAAKLLEKIPTEYRKAAQNGSIAIESFTGEVGEETLNAIQDYREWVQKGADLTQQAEETLTEIANLAKQAIDNIASDYENKSSIPNIKIEQLEAYNALIETTKGAESAKVYQAMIKENNKNIKILEQQRDKMQAELNAQVEAGNIKKYSQAWYDAINDIAAVDTEIIELTTDTANYQDTINELHWEHFDNLISRFEAISDEANNLIDILGSKDLVDKDSAEWTDEGITALGLYAQQMEVAEMQAKKYEEEIKYLNKNWKSLGYTEQEYVEKLEELKSGQYDAIKAYNDTKDAIVDLNQERIDAIKSGIEKEISAYEELIEKKKELLDSEKD